MGEWCYAVESLACSGLRLYIYMHQPFPKCRKVALYFCRVFLNKFYLAPLVWLSEKVLCFESAKILVMKISNFDVLSPESMLGCPGAYLASDSRVTSAQTAG